MKTPLLLLILILNFGLTFAQKQFSDFNGNKSDQPRDPHADLMNFVPNEVIVKFKDAVPVAAGVRMRAVGVSSVDKLLQSHGITSLEKLFPAAQKQQSTRMMRSPQGNEFKVPALDKIYRISIPSLQYTDSIPVNIFQLIEELKALPEVEYAEPNYIYSIDDMQPAGPVLTAEDVAKLKQNIQKSTTTAVIPNDPLYGQQWYIPAVNADSVWQQTTGDTTQVIAILDTGVDWNHPDLKNKIWTNTNEIPDNGIDDDNNGLIDDVRGWDYINNDNNPTDDNSHGTHVAGIAAAETNNAIGIAGVNWKAKIMPIKVFQSSGRGDAATITAGIIYAANHGATVINMSFGSYARSLAMEDALANAYATSILVAAAGNDGIDIDACQPNGQFFPASLSFVLGVLAPDGSFSNTDCNGPIFSNFAELFNYEIKAPGTNILSTIPNGNYRVYQGTSMAAPVIAGLVSIYRSLRPTESQELLFGNLINSTGIYVNIQKALSIVPIPKLTIVTFEVTDTLEGDKDGRPDAGETIELKVKVRNTWGHTDDVKVGIAFNEFEDTTTAAILSAEASIGSVSAYATGYNIIPLKLKISEDIADGRDIRFLLKTWYGDHQGETIQPIFINVENGVELKGIISHDLTLYPDKQYIITDNIAVPEGVTLTIKPGTTLKFQDGKKMVVTGNINSIGKADSLITFTKRDNGNGWNGILIQTYTGCKFTYSVFEYIGDGSGGCAFSDYYSSTPIENCLFRYNNSERVIYGSYIKNSSFYSNNCYNRLIDCIGGEIYNNNFINNDLQWGGAISIHSLSANQFYKNNIFSNLIPSENKEANITTTSYEFKVCTFDSLYFGTTNEDKINKAIEDFPERGGGIWFNILNKMDRPSTATHGLVWKVVVNGKDAQDEFDQLEPLGVGRQKFEVYFNRAMDVKYPPTVSMGIRFPYSQNSIAEDGSWSADSTIYTVYKNVGLTTGDGINTLRVYGAKDMDHFEIPIEDRRFRVIVSAASSSSLEFMATAGLGKVNLEWNISDLADGLGYNMYRMQHINDTTLTAPVMINSSLIADTLYTDFAVTPNKKYYYYYKIVRTDLSETDSSRVVSAIPFTASKGDANGDLAVNVLDITSIVAYLLNDDPHPFISEAADMNSDGNINVLDIVGVVNKILNIPQGAPRISMNQQVDLYLQNDTLFADANGPIGGIQLDLSGVSSIVDIQVLQPLQGFESGYGVTGGGLRLLYYSLSGKFIPGGNRIPLLKMKKGSTIADAIFSERNGSPIRVKYILTRIGNISNNMNQTAAELGQNYPNPVNGKTIIPVRIYEPADEAVLHVVNMIGQQVDMIRLINPFIGEHLLSWNPAQNKGLFVYVLEIRNGNKKMVCPVRKMIVQ